MERAERGCKRSRRCSLMLGPCGLMCLVHTTQSATQVHLFINRNKAAQMFSNELN